MEAGIGGGDEDAEQCVGKCSWAKLSSVATQALLAVLGLQRPGVYGLGRGVHAHWVLHRILSAEERVMSPASW